MKIIISYFYQIRFFKPNMIPVSTAMWDPKWYHEFKEQKHIFKDKNGVYNGIRDNSLHPGNWFSDDCAGPERCALYGTKPENCYFLKRYRQQLDEINFDKKIKSFELLAQKIQEKEKFKEEPIIVLIVHETPKSPCSERVVLQEWFKDNGYILEEFDKNNFN